jgi:hypothetical protein
MRWLDQLGCQNLSINWSKEPEEGKEWKIRRRKKVNEN